MGCGSSNASGGDVQSASPVVPSEGKQKSPKDAGKEKGEKKGASPTAQQSAAAQPAEVKPVEKKKLVSRASGAGDQPHSPPADVGSVPCDSDGSHGHAAVWCVACETNLCDTCDGRVHADGGKHEHHLRTVLATGQPRKNKHHASGEAEEKKGKFVVKASSPSSGGAAAGSNDNNPASPRGGGGAPGKTEQQGQRSKFQVGKFTSPNDAKQQESEHRPGADTGATATSQRIAVARGPPLMHVSEEQLSKLGAAELEALWKKYDRDGNGSLSRSELKLLADDVILRVIQLVKDDIQSQNGSLTQREIDERAEKEQWFQLPGQFNEREGQEIY